MRTFGFGTTAAAWSAEGTRLPCSPASPVLGALSHVRAAADTMNDDAPRVRGAAVAMVVIVIISGYPLSSCRPGNGHCSALACGVDEG
jgi:hypothetical protein